MAIDPRLIERLFQEVPLTEPLLTFKVNVDTLINLVGQTSQIFKDKVSHLIEIEKKRIKLGQWQVDFKQQLDSYLKSPDGQSQILDFQKNLPPEVSSNPKTVELTQEAFKEYLENQIDKEYESFFRDVNQFFLTSNEIQANIKKEELKLKQLLPMAFIFLISTWDAFVLDSARKIMKLHPELISKSENLPGIDTSTIWNCNDIDDVKNYLIDCEIRILDSDRKKLLKCFKDYWGIDWERSTIPQEKLIEITARRDILVHNKGLVNNQYIKMVSKMTNFKFGDCADITDEYFNDSINSLVTQAIYIHNIADIKHYSKI